MKETLARVSSGGKGGSVAVTGRHGVALESSGEAGWTQARRAWAQGGRRGAVEARQCWSSVVLRDELARVRLGGLRRGRGTEARGWRAEEA